MLEPLIAIYGISKAIGYKAVGYDKVNQLIAQNISIQTQLTFIGIVKFESPNIGMGPDMRWGLIWDGK